MLRSRWQALPDHHLGTTVDEVHELFPAHIFGFNGNRVRARVVAGLANVYGANRFVETGTSHAATTVFARKYLGSRVDSCDVSLSNYLISRLVTLGLGGVQLHVGHSATFLDKLITAEIARGDVGDRFLFYLDAHEGNDPESLPILEELHAIGRLPEFLVVIDDFKIPHDRNFHFGIYGGRIVEFALIRDWVMSSHRIQCLLPNYPASVESGFVAGYAVIWKSSRLDAAFAAKQFPMNLLGSVHDPNCGGEL